MTSARIVYYSGSAATPPTLRTTTPLTAGSTFSTGTIDIDGGTLIMGTVFSDQPGTLYIEQSYDGSNWDVSTSYAISASDGKGFQETVVADFGRIRLVNGATNQGIFRLSVNLR